MRATTQAEISKRICKKLCVPQHQTEIRCTPTGSHQFSQVLKIVAYIKTTAALTVLSITEGDRQVKSLS